MNIYLLSILDNIGHTATFCTAVFGIAALATTVCLMDLEGAYRQALTKEERATVKKLQHIATVIAIISMFVATMTPSRRDLMSAYVMAEGKHLVTVENFESATNALLNRFDHYIGYIQPTTKEQ